jgi:excisionase family DNA binding protein
VGLSNVSGPDEPDNDWILSAGDVARLFGVGTNAVGLWADEGLLPARRTAGGHRRFRLADLERLRESLTLRSRRGDEP